MTDKELENLKVDIDYQNLSPMKIKILGLVKIAKSIKISTIAKYLETTVTSIINNIEEINEKYCQSINSIIKLHPLNQTHVPDYAEFNWKVDLSDWKLVNSKIGEDKVLFENLAMLQGLLELNGDLIKLRDLQLILSDYPRTNYNDDVNRFNLEYIITLLVYTALSGQVDIYLDADEMIECRKTSIVPSKLIGKNGQTQSLKFPILSDFPNEIVENVYTILKKVNLISLNSIIKRVNKTEALASEFVLSKNSLLLILAQLTSKGWLQGKILGNDLLVIGLPFENQLSISQEIFYLKEYDYAILGYLRASESPTLGDLSEKFGWTKEFSNRHVQSIFSKTNLKGEISRSGQILLDAEVQLPKNTQIQYLNDEELLILGIGSIWGTGSIDDLSKQLNRHQENVYFSLLTLTGYGIVDLELNKNQFSIKSVEIAEPSIMIDQHPNPNLRQFSRIIEEKRNPEIQMDQLNLSEILKNWHGNKHQFWLALAKLHLFGYYKSIELVNSGIITISKLTQIPKIPCYNCGANIFEDDICLTCGKAKERCIVCKGNISNGKVISCPHCNRYAHKNHLIEWLMIKSICPGCRGKLSKKNIISVGVN